MTLVLWKYTDTSKITSSIRLPNDRSCEANGLALMGSNDNWHAICRGCADLLLP
ncbi:hypothetical protein D3C71_2143930 [compost metagenome]